MGVESQIVDGLGTGARACVDGENNLNVTATQLPPMFPQGTVQIYRDLLADSSGVTDMLVDGSTTAVDYYVEASDEGDRYISSLAFVVSDAGMTLSKFGNITALTTGLEIFYLDPTGKKVDIHDAIKSNFDLVQLCGGDPAIGSTFIVANIAGNSEGILPVLNFTKIFGVPWGVRLPKGSKERLVVRVRDNVSGIDRFDVTAYGFDRLI